MSLQVHDALSLPSQERTAEKTPHVVFLAHFESNLYVFRRPVMQALVRRGWRVTALQPDGPSARKWADEGVDFVPCDLSQSGRNPAREVPVVLGLARTLRKLQPDIVHTFTAKPNIYGTFAARLAGVSSVVNTITGLGSGFVERDGPDVTRAVLEGLYRVSGSMNSAVIFQNDDDHAFFLDRRLIPARRKTAFIRGSGVDLQRYSPTRFTAEDRSRIRRDLNISEDAVVVLMVARLIWDKGIRQFREAAAALKREYGDRVVFLSVGDFYRDNPSCVPEAYIEDAVASEVLISAGWREDIPELLHASDIVALPSYLREGVPHALQQACAMARPIVTTDNPGCRDTVQPNVNGFLVPIKEVAALAQALRPLIEDEALRARMGAASRRKAEQEYGIEANIRQHVELYESLL
jgi:N,N'-diacetylbacillosaminyl-diphospho-undecaprenol alpha-1,3-N-acetylgalactosaminyltransferase